MSTEKWNKDRTDIVNIAQPLVFPAKDTDVVFMASPTYKIGGYLLQFREENAYRGGSLWYRSWYQHHILHLSQKGGEISLRKRRYQYFERNQNIYFELMDSLCSKVVLETRVTRSVSAPQHDSLTISLHCAAFMYRLIRRNYPYDRKVLLLCPSPIAVLANERQNFQVNHTQITQEIP